MYPAQPSYPPPAAVELPFNYYKLILPRRELVQLTAFQLKKRLCALRQINNSIEVQYFSNFWKVERSERQVRKRLVGMGVA